MLLSGELLQAMDGVYEDGRVADAKSRFEVEASEMLAVLLLGCTLILVIPTLPKHELHLSYWAAAFVVEWFVIWAVWPFDTDS